jgi:hypothetical protein
MPESKAPKHDPKWAKAKTVCRLNMEDIRMAKALGISPKALVKNNPSPSERWKEPVKYWIRGLYEKRFGKETAQASELRKPGFESGSEAVISENLAPEEEAPF